MLIDIFTGCYSTKSQLILWPTLRIRGLLVYMTYSVSTMQSDELAHLSKVYSVIAGACIPIFHCILNNSA